MIRTLTQKRMKRLRICDTIVVGSMYSHSRPFQTDKPLWLDGLFLLVDTDYVSHSDSPLTLGSISI
jgi:hypothetical protein